MMEIREFGDLSGPFIAPARGGQASSLIVLLHGWGADGKDLADLARPFSLRFPGAAFYVPDGPAPCKMNPMGREWFDIDDRIDGPLEAAPVVNDAIDAALTALGVSSSALALAGFSQGGMMSLHCGLRFAVPPAAIVSFSGALLGHDDLPPASDVRSYPPVQLVHGTEDMVVPFFLQKQSGDSLRRLGIDVEYCVCQGLGHGIDPDGLSAAIRFLANYLPS
jgi:phospholipase/carboxylesterase